MKKYIKDIFPSQKDTSKDVFLVYGLGYHNVEYYQVMNLFIHDCVHLLYDL